MSEGKTIYLITKPNRCVLAFGIPTYRKAFLQSLNNKNADYVNRYKKSWPTYSSKIVKPITALTPDIKKTGLTIIPDPTVEDFKKTDLTLEVFKFLFTKYDVIILFSHWKDDKIEFHEGLVPIEKIVDVIPDDYNNIIDFSVCHPEPLIRLINEKKPNCRSRYSKNKVEEPEYWLYFYSELFQKLFKEDWYYFDAFRATIYEQLNETNEK